MQNSVDTFHGDVNEIEVFYRLCMLSSDLLCTAGFDGYFRQLNPAWENTLGFTTQELLAKPFWDLIHSEDHAAVTSELEKLAAGGKTLAFEVRLRNRQGSYQWFLWSATAFSGDNLIYAIGKDITKLKQVEDALEKSEMKFHSVVETAIDAIISANDSGNIIFWNKGAQTLFGYKEEEVLGKPLTLLMPETYREAHRRMLARHVATGETRFIGKTAELHGLRKGGSEFPLELSLARWKTAEGTFYTAIIRDITERKRMEESLRTLSLTDDLTGLYNRRGFLLFTEQYLTLARRGVVECLLVFVDIDGLKQINDCLGHKEGDLAISKTAGILRQFSRETDIVARLSGDEFVILVVNPEPDSAKTVTTRIQNALEASNTRNNRNYNLSVSVGVKRIDANSLFSIEDLIAEADGAMYEHKRGKRLNIQRQNPA